VPFHCLILIRVDANLILPEGSESMDDYLDTYLHELMEKQQYRNGIFPKRRSLKELFLSLRRRRL